MSPFFCFLCRLDASAAPHFVSATLILSGLSSLLLGCLGLFQLTLSAKPILCYFGFE